MNIANAYQTSVNGTKANIKHALYNYAIDLIKDSYVTVTETKELYEHYNKSIDITIRSIKQIPYLVDIVEELKDFNLYVYINYSINLFHSSLDSKVLTLKHIQRHFPNSHLYSLVKHKSNNKDLADNLTKLQEITDLYLDILKD